MKRQLLSIGMVLHAFAASAQFTLTPDNHPVWTPFNLNQFSTGASALTPSANGNWNYGNLSNPSTSVVEYAPETVPFFLANGIDFYLGTVVDLAPGAGYNCFLEWDHSEEGVDEAGIDIPLQTYSLEPFTGNSNDMLFIPEQAKMFDSPRRAIKFPAAHGDSWSWSSRRVVDFELTVASAMLSDAPCQQVLNLSGTEEMVGYGQMSVYTPGGPSVAYEVMLKKNIQQTVDSIYLNGQPAPEMLLSVFGITQGQVSSQLYRIFAYRENHSTPLLNMIFSNAGFSQVQNLFTDSESLTTVGVDEAVGGFATLLYPNPADASFNFQMLGGNTQLQDYEVMDINGRVLLSGTVAPGQGMMTISTQDLAAGTYVLRVSTADGRTLSERLSVQH